MKVSDIKCNGVGMTAPSKGIKPFITIATSIFRMRHTNSEIFEKFPEGEDYYEGVRFKSNDAVADRLCSAITECAIMEYYGDGKEIDMPVLEEIIHVFADSLSGADMDTLIIDAMRDCASADHWYTFEKEWNTY